APTSHPIHLPSLHDALPIYLTPILSTAGLAADSPQFCVTASNAPFDKGELAERMVRDMLPAIERKSGGEWRYEVRNFNRAIGARSEEHTSELQSHLNLVCRL